MSALKKEERTEDLNPRSDDIEEKVKRMMDPSVPDEAPLPPPKAAVVMPKPATEVLPDTPTDQNQPPSAPELPGASKSSPEAAPEIKQITITDDNQSPQEVAEKLDEAIAGLGTQSSTDDRDEVTDATANDPAVISDPETDKAVDSIIAEESDEVLEVEDAIRDSDEPVEEDKGSRFGRIGKKIKALWAKPAVRWGLLIGAVAVVLAVMSIPVSRYFVLNTAGVRAGSSLQVLDDSTQQPLKNVQVKMGNSSGLTDSEGNVKLKKVKLGAQTLTVEKRAFAPVSQKITVGLGSNPLGDFKLTPTGTQYSFTVTDFLSGKPISKVEADDNNANALADEKGVIKLTIDKPDDQQLVVSLKLDGYRTEQVTIDPNDKTDHPVKLVPAHKQVFISKRSGKYDVYGVYIDGKDEKVILAGSGSEQEASLVLVPHPTADVVAYVSTRGNQHNSDGFLLSNLILINTTDNTTTSVATSERVQIIGWSGDYLVYVQIAAGASASNPKRYRLVAYNFQDSSSKELASANYFNDVTMASGAIYYAPSGAYQSSPANFYKVNPDGSSSQSLFGQEVWNILRTAYDHFALSVQQQWYDYHLGDKAPTKMSAAPANQTSRVYIDSPDGKHSIWVDQRDGKSVLLAYDTVAKTDNILQTKSGISYPIQWLNDNTLVYRVKTEQETADYAISVDGGNPVKIKDVTNTAGISTWYYY